MREEEKRPAVLSKIKGTDTLNCLKILPPGLYETDMLWCGTVLGQEKRELSVREDEDASRLSFHNLVAQEIAPSA